MSDVKLQFEVMGTVASITVAQMSVTERTTTVLEDVREYLHEIDDRFSHYKITSEASRYGRGELTRDELSDGMRHVLAECSRLHELSGGVFTIKNPRDGELDLAGYVKGWSIESAAELLRAADVNDFLINVGGDIYAAGHATPGQPWNVAVTDSRTPAAIVAGVELVDQGIATSGTAERGDHIWGRRTNDLISFTAIGASVTLADGYATVGFAMGVAGLEWVEQQGYHAFALTVDGELPCTASMAQLLIGQVSLDG